MRNGLYRQWGLISPAGVVGSHRPGLQGPRVQDPSMTKDLPTIEVGPRRRAGETARDVEAAPVGRPDPPPRTLASAFPQAALGCGDLLLGPMERVRIEWTR